MLVITRREREVVVVEPYDGNDDGLRIEVLSIHRNRVKLGLTADRSLRITREELAAWPEADPRPDAAKPAALGNRGPVGAVAGLDPAEQARRLDALAGHNARQLAADRAMFPIDTPYRKHAEYYHAGYTTALKQTAEALRLRQPKPQSPDAETPTQIPPVP